MGKVGVAVLKNELSQYIRAVTAGETILVTDGDRVVAAAEATPGHDNRGNDARSGREPERPVIGVDPPVVFPHHPAGASLSARIAFCFRIRSCTSGLKPASLKSLIQRSGAISGKSEPNSILCFNCPLA